MVYSLAPSLGLVLIGFQEVLESHFVSISAGAQITLSDPHVEGNTVTGGYSYRTPDPDGLRTGAVAIVVENGRIASHEVTPDEDTLRRLQGYFDPPTEVAQLDDPPESDIAFNRRTPFVPLDNPVMLSAQEMPSLNDNEQVLGLDHEGMARAYPLRMLWFHHIVNDTVGGIPYLVTF